MTTRYDDKIIIGLYAPQSIEPDSDALARWWPFQECVTEHIGINAEYIVGEFKNKPHRLVDDHGYKMNRYKTRFQRELKCDNLKFLYFYAMNKYPKGNHMLDWDYATLFGKGMLLYGFDLGMSSLKRPAILNEYIDSLIMKQTFLDMTYGFCSIMPREFAPNFYAMGTPCSGTPKYLICETNTWTIEGRKQCSRILRNIYGIQIVNRQHLDLSVGKQSLRQWIVEKPYRGRLIDINDELSFWTFREEPDDISYLQWNSPNVIRVMKELMDYNFFLWQKHIAKDEIQT